MTDIKPDEDLREEIINNMLFKAKYYQEDSYSKDFIKDCMDEYFEKRVKEELLPWMSENNVGCLSEDSIMNPKHPKENRFYYKKEWITAESLFENFL